ncbi:uncharacterized protein K452DRAFT_30324 [Aplosporella prunicola CBS 121167]|uniref:Uncharacterized protein n=1 Tax=Aplosporella prunicola CBS 121167 TaxID=1176127 RepID=A0A6A6BD97_9PEZI|nr:uncharacterized protein K452DRAFT_30324 [Aplosporella prunicola CBS 121167]KAF2141568.1 hypothetical protein K452DRAFT_30324 [Aplosporella prunicola CBS 121167]
MLIGDTRWSGWTGWSSRSRSRTLAVAGSLQLQHITSFVAEACIDIKRAAAPAPAAVVARLRHTYPPTTTTRKNPYPRPVPTYLRTLRSRPTPEQPNMYITTVIMSVFALLSSSTSTNGNTNTNGTLASSSDSANTQTFLLDNFVLHDPSGEPGNYIRTLNFDVSAADSADKDDDDKASNDDASDAKNHALVHCAASWDYRMDGYPRGYVRVSSALCAE